MKAKRRRLTKRNAPRLAGTERIGNLLLVEKVIIHARPVNGPSARGSRRVGGILPGVFAQLVVVREGKGAR